MPREAVVRRRLLPASPTLSASQSTCHQMWPWHKMTHSSERATPGGGARNRRMTRSAQDDARVSGSQGRIERPNTTPQNG